MTELDGRGEMSTIVLRGVTKSYGSVTACDNVDLTVEPGEILTVIGPSGCGKSTVLRLICGLERPDAGVVEVSGHRVADADRFVPPERRQVGMVFQGHALFPHLTVARNVAFGLSSVPADERRRRVERVLTMVRLPHLAERYPHELSGGEQQRVALARALAPKPRAVLLDEPFSSLDENLRAQVRAEIVEVLRHTGITTILVTHDQTEALTVGDRVMVMRDGRIEQLDTPEQVFERPESRFVASFMGDADFIRAHVHSALLTCEIGPIATVPGWSAEADVDVVLRPHEVALTPDPGRVGDGPVVSGVEYHGAFVLHTVLLTSGQTLRSWQPHAVRHEIGTPVTVSFVPGITPTLLQGDRAVRLPPVGQDV